MGLSAVDRLLNGESGVMVALQGREIGTVSLEDATTLQREIGEGYFNMAYTLSR
jgi:6-phosphofructokinase